MKRLSILYCIHAFGKSKRRRLLNSGAAALSPISRKIVSSAPCCFFKAAFLRSGIFQDAVMTHVHDVLLFEHFLARQFVQPLFKIAEQLLEQRLVG